MNIKSQIKNLKAGESVEFKIEGLFFSVSFIDSCGKFYFLSHQGGNVLEMLEIGDFLSKFESAVLGEVFRFVDESKSIDPNAPFDPDNF